MKGDMTCTSIAAASIRGQGDPGPDDARSVRELPTLRLRSEQGISVADPSDRVGRLRPDLHPSPFMGVRRLPALPLRRTVWILPTPPMQLGRTPVVRYQTVLP